jgi:phosphoglycerate dehydrogenase-like enzyme
VALASTGIDQAPDALFAPDRTVTCARGAASIPISEFVVACMLAFEKRMPEVWLSEPPEHWNLKSLGTLWQRTVGIVGLGGIALAVAERARAFDMRVLATRRSKAPSPHPHIEVVDFDELLAESDHLVLAAPATSATRHLLDAAAFSRMKQGIHLVNIARGSLIDQDALRAALDDDTVATASLDVCDPEPLPAGHWLYDHPKVRLSAHVSWASPQWIDRTVDGFIANLVRYVGGEPLEGVVDPDQRY